MEVQEPLEMFAPPEAEAAQAIQSNKMGVQPEGRLLFTMSLPVVISMLLQALYNIVDSIFVTRLSEDALTAVSLAYPIQMLMIAVAVGTGVGMNALISRRLGQRRFDEASSAATNGLFVLLLSALAFLLFGLFGARPFIAMQANGKGMPSTDQSRAMRDNWMPEGVEPEFRVPVLRAPRTRREQQLRMAGDVAASMVWTLYAKTCMELLGYGAGRLNRLKQEALANYRQVNEEGRADGLDVAMEHLRRCACDALQTDDIIVEDIPDEERAKQADRDYEEQKDAFFRRNMAGAMGRCAAPAGTAVLAPGEIKKKIEAVLQQAAAPESWERRRLR